MKLTPNQDAQLRQVAHKLSEAEALLGEVRQGLYNLYDSMEQPTVAAAPAPVYVAPAAVDKPTAQLVPKPKTGGAERTVIGFVAAAGVLITLLGVSFLVWAVWDVIGPLGRVVAAWLIAALLFGGASLVHHKQLAEQGKAALLTASQLTSVLTVMATVSLLHWWSPLTGAIVMLVLLAFYSGVGRWWRSQSILIVSNVAGLILFSVYIISGDFFSFPVIAPTLFLAAGSMQYHWTAARTTAAIAGPVAVLIAAADQGFPISLTVLLGVAVFAAIALLDTWQHPSDLHLGCYAPLAMLLIGGIRAEDFLELTIMVFLIIVFTILSVLFHGSHATLALTLLPVVFFFWWTKSPALGSAQLIERPWLVALYFLAFSGVACWLARNNRYGWYPWAAMFIVAVGLSWELADAVLAKKPLWLTDPVALLQVCSILVFMVTIFLFRGALSSFATPAKIVVGLGGLHLSTLVVVGGLTFIFGLLGESGMKLGYLLGHAAVSILWLVLGAYILVVSRALSQQASLIVGLVLTIAAMAKLLLFDMSTLDVVIRFFTFILAGVILLVIASLRARRTKTLQQLPQETACVGSGD